LELSPPFGEIVRARESEDPRSIFEISKLEACVTVPHVEWYKLYPVGTESEPTRLLAKQVNRAKSLIWILTRTLPFSLWWIVERKLANLTVPENHFAIHSRATCWTTERSVVLYVIIYITE
jgi:hypothetical protein